MKISELNGVDILIYATKIDKENSLSLKEISEELELKNIKDRHYYLEGVDNLNGIGIKNGMKWLYSMIQNNPNYKEKFNIPCKFVKH